MISPWELVVKDKSVDLSRITVKIYYLLYSHPANEDYIGHSMAVPVTFQISAL